MAAITSSIKNIQGRKKVEEAMPATPIAFFRKAKAFSEASQKTLGVQNCVTWVTPSYKGGRQSKCLALSDYIVEMIKEQRVWQWVDGLPINSVGPRA